MPTSDVAIAPSTSVAVPVDPSVVNALSSALDSVDSVLTEKQRSVRDVLAGPERHLLVYGGSRSGKTFLLCMVILVRALLAPGSRHLICRLNKVDVEKSVMKDTWPKVFRALCPGERMVINKTDGVHILPNGSEIWFGGLDTEDAVEKILGREFASIYVNESSQVAYQTILTLRTRLAQSCVKSDGRPLALKMYYDLNPTGEGHWTFQEFRKGVRPDNPKIAMPKGTHAWASLNPADNPYLPKAYLEELENMPERWRKRFKDGEYLTEVPGTLWPITRIETLRVDGTKVPQMARVVVAVDPSGSDGVGGDKQGIVVAGKGVDGHYYVLADRSVRLSPAGWGKVITDAAVEFGADCVVAEVNFGGAMVEAIVMSSNPNVRYKAVTASRGKVIRAEPVAALYEQAVAHHVGYFPDLESQMGMFTTAGFQGSGSPDRADALVWALTELAGIKLGQGLMDYYRDQAQAAEAAARGEQSREEVDFVAIDGPASISIVYGNEGRVYPRAQDPVTGQMIFRVHPDDAPGMLSQMGWRQA